jgi:hypothetical protein
MRDADPTHPDNTTDAADQVDQATIDQIRARGPRWIPGDQALRLMDQIVADAEDALEGLRVSS